VLCNWGQGLQEITIIFLEWAKRIWPMKLCAVMGGWTGEHNHVFVEPASILCRCNGTGIGGCVMNLWNGQEPDPLCQWNRAGTEKRCHIYLEFMSELVPHYASVNEAGQRVKEPDWAIIFV
jgi:hypothetical protein